MIVFANADFPARLGGGAKEFEVVTCFFLFRGTPEASPKNECVLVSFW